MQENLLHYSYPEGTTVELPGHMLYALMQVLETVKQAETHTGFSYKYATKAKEKNNADGLLESVELTLKDYTSATSYMAQQPQEYTTMVGNMAMDLLLLLQAEHARNIKEGKAIHVGEFKIKENDGIKLA